MMTKKERIEEYLKTAKWYLKEAIERMAEEEEEEYLDIPKEDWEKLLKDWE